MCSCSRPQMAHGERALYPMPSVWLAHEQHLVLHSCTPHAAHVCCVHPHPACMHAETKCS